MRHVTLIAVAAVLATAGWVASRPPVIEAQDRQVTFPMVEKIRGRLTRIEERLRALETAPTGPVTAEEIARFERLKVVAEVALVTREPEAPPEPGSEHERLVERNRQLNCRRNLKELGTVFTLFQQEHQGRPPYDGVSMFLYFRVKDMAIREGQETLLICPADPQAIMPTTPERQTAYDRVDLTNPPNDMCSYAVRDFTRYPLKWDAQSPQIIACDRMGRDGRTAHHKDGLCVLFDDGSARFMTRKDLGLGPDDPIVVGPDSKHPLLKKVVYRPGKK